MRLLIKSVSSREREIFFRALSKLPIDREGLDLYIIKSKGMVETH